MSTLFRLISSVFSGEEFVNAHESESIEDIYAGLEEIPYQLSNEQKQAVINVNQEILDTNRVIKMPDPFLKIL